MWYLRYDGKQKAVMIENEFIRHHKLWCAGNAALRP